MGIFKEKELDSISQHSFRSLGKAQATVTQRARTLTCSLIRDLGKGSAKNFSLFRSWQRDACSWAKENVCDIKRQQPVLASVCIASDMSELPSPQASKRES